ncbi:hypothetical protein BCR44DRAFT_40496 [Catenaria anguillulae PL171]|uniref:Nudix hydrolase domain-containing protein n=1 Tax=Catenaria anguillulae PL171 TaxID=765915 RepID=A0A1Y2I076_9FUNG|nr:hypothetical protein BCR44DRAFT_40496 [Catenaria anguillulae PL171]
MTPQPATSAAAAGSAPASTKSTTSIGITMNGTSLQAEWSLRDLVHQCNNVPSSLESWITQLNAPLNLCPTDVGHAFLTVDNVRVGLLTPPVAMALLEHPHAFERVSQTQVALKRPAVDASASVHADPDARVELTRSQWIAEIVEQWRTFNDGTQLRFEALMGWRDELYPVYGKGGSLAFTVERAASGLLGVRTYGCHMTAYTLPPGTAHPHSNLHLWLARRSLTKPTFPGQLDNTAAGGLPVTRSSTGQPVFQRPFECMVREAHEEASISESVARSGIVAAGAVSYYQRQEHLPSLGGIAGPETQYVFDLQVDEAFAPEVNDGEVHGFMKVRVDEAMQLLKSGQFKPNCAVVLIDFLVRHGYITTDNEPDYLEIVHGCHRPLEWEFPGPRWSLLKD